MRVYVLVRHGHAMDAPAFKGPSRERPLTERGHEQARALAALLAGERITAVYASPALRCQQTAEHLAKAFGLTMEIRQGLLEGRMIALDQHESGSVLVAHGDNIPALLAELRVKCHELDTACAWRVELTAEGTVNAAVYIRHDGH